MEMLTTRLKQSTIGDRFSTLHESINSDREATHFSAACQHRWHWAAPKVLALSLVVAACGEEGVDSAGNGLSTSPPTSISLVAAGEFDSPVDAVASPDGSVFYFNAKTLETDQRPGIFSVPSEGGAVELLFAGAPLETPTGLLMSCDGQSLYIADMSLDEGVDPSASDGGAIYMLDVDSRNLSRLDIEGIAVPSGLAMDPDCSTLHVTGFNEAQEPALFTVREKSSTGNNSSLNRTQSSAGGIASERYSGTPLVSPSGVFVDEDAIAWVMDHLAVGEDGPGVLFSITPDGGIDAVVSDLRMGAPGGVTLTAGGVTAVIPELDESGNAQLLSVDTTTGERAVLPTPEISVPGGIRTARLADRMVLVDINGLKIYSIK